MILPIVLLDMYPETMFTQKPALFRTVKAWKQPRCPSIDAMNKLVGNPDNTCYSALHRNQLSNSEKTWKRLERILQSERSQHEKATYCMFPTI